MATLKDLGILALGTRLRVLSEAMMAGVKGFYDDFGLDFEPRWFPVFQLVQREPGLSIAACAERIGVSHTAVKDLTRPMVAAGLITLEPDPRDARAKALRLTEAGEVLFTRLKPAWFALQQALDIAFPDGGVTEILMVLERLEDAVADRAVPRSLRQVLAPAAVLDRLRLVAYDPADPDHKRHFAALNIEWLQTWFFVEETDYRMFDSPETTILAPGGVIVMAEVAGQVVGTGALINRGDGIYELGKMAVSKPFQGKGIGARLVARLEDEARALGLRTLYLVSSTRLPHAVPMYRKLGWVDTDLPLHRHYQRSDISLQKRL